MMNTFGNSNARNKRNLLNSSFPISFDTRSLTSMNSTKHSYDGLFINNMGLIPDPLKKNLADSIITADNINLKTTKEKDFFTPKLETAITRQSMDFYPKLSGLFNIFSGLISGMGAMFQRREQDPAPQYFDCFDSEYLENSAEPMTRPVPWLHAKFEVQNKSGPVNSLFDENQSTKWNTDMISDCKTQFIENQINQVHQVFNNDTEPVQVPCTKQFESSSFEIFEDAFCPEDSEYLQNDSYFEYNSPFFYHQEELLESYAPQRNAELMDVTKESTPPLDENTNTSTSNNDKYNVVLSCEDKVNRIKELLKSKCKNENRDTVKLEEVNTELQGTEEIENEAVFGNEINISDNTSESTDFDEFTGRFCSSSVGSNDSFEIVFSDYHSQDRQRLPSESESEDSFIVFDRSSENTDSCYTSSDVVAETDGNDNESSDAEDSDVEDSGCGNLLPHLSRTEDLIDDKVYNEDVVDCAFTAQVHYDTPISILSKDKNLGTSCKKQKKVTFSTLPPEEHYMEQWVEEAKEARKGGWSPSIAADRERFTRRIANVEMAISWVLKPQHRTIVMFQRFMPWWNAQKRRELEEKRPAEDAPPDVCGR